ncbi:MAG: Coenzyme F420 hydrogenase/dehydrogenase, beta subunit C-terminal domain [Candidatus Methanospirareceae archaeon]
MMKMGVEAEVGKGEAEWEVKVAEKKLKDRVYFENLKAVVIDTELCSRCLTCVSICPGGLLVNEEDRVDFPDFEDKCLDCGACVRVCPRYVYEPKSGLGDYIEIVAGRSKRFTGQDGAMATEIIASAIDMGMIDQGLFVDRSGRWETSIFHVRNPRQFEIGTLGGTKYVFANVLPALKEAIRFTKKGVGLVGTPCMISGVRRLQEEFPVFREKVKLSVGLFCTENFHYKDLTNFLREEKGIEIEKILKTDISKGSMYITIEGREKRRRVKMAEFEERGLVAKGCDFCTDFTAVESDVSVGSVGSAKGFSTVIVRNENAKEVIDYIRERGDADFSEEIVMDEIDYLINFKKKREKNIKEIQ